MNILVALDSFKGSLSSLQAGQAVLQGIASILPEAHIILKPLADGGEGTLQALMDALQGEIVTTEVMGPQGRPIKAQYGLAKDLAVIEMAQSSGLIQIQDGLLDPHQARSDGFGQLIQEALNQNPDIRELILCLGGSATTEAGIGMLNVLGVRFLDSDHNLLPPVFDSLDKIEFIDLSKMDPRMKEIAIIVACDVDNPLTGEQGAIAVYGPQKGVKKEEIEQMDQSMTRYADTVARNLKKDLRHAPGAGAAGGMGFALLSFFDQVRFESGSRLIFERLDFASALKQADLLITGEGRLDGSSLAGKGPVALCQLAKKIHPEMITLLLAGSLADGAEKVLKQGVDDYFCILQKVSSLEQAMEPEQARENLTACTKEIFRLIGLKEQMHG